MSPKWYLNIMHKSIFFHTSDQDLTPTQSTYCHISQADNYENGTLEEIVFQDLLDYFTEDKIENIINIAYTKLQNGGSLHIQGSDLRQLSIALVFNTINEELVKKILYPHKKSIHTISEILDMLKKVGFNIENKRYVNVFEYYIKAYK